MDSNENTETIEGKIAGCPDSYSFKVSPQRISNYKEGEGDLSTVETMHLQSTSTPAHTVLSVQQFLTKNGRTPMPHPLYSLSLASK